MGGNEKDISNYLFGFQKFSIKHFVYSEGSYLYDENGRRYIDFHTGNGVAFLGHRNKYVVEKLRHQLEKIMVLGSSFYCDIRGEAISLLKEIAPSGLRHFAFFNSGSEAVEFALKIFFKHYPKGKLVSFNNSFHGRTIGALSVTGRSIYKKGFPLIKDIVFLPYNNVEVLEETDFSGIHGIILEVIQGEGGVIPGTREFFDSIKKIVRRYGLFFVIDEIQSGFGRTGELWSYKIFGLEPNVLLAGKSIGGGFPVSVVFADDVAVDAIKPWEHGSTFGGNPMAMAAISGGITALLQDNVVEKTRRKGRIFFSKLVDEIVMDNLVREVRGRGLMIGLKTRVKSDKIVSCMLEKGVLSLKAGPNIVRLLPPYTISERDMDDFIVAFKSCIMGV